MSNSNLEHIIISFPKPGAHLHSGSYRIVEPAIFKYAQKPLVATGQDDSRADFDVTYVPPGTDYNGVLVSLRNQYPTEPSNYSAMSKRRLTV